MSAVGISNTDLSEVSLAIPATDEARNVRRVIEALPVGLHEVILVDGAARVDANLKAAQPAGVTRTTYRTATEEAELARTVELPTDEHSSSSNDG